MIQRGRLHNTSARRPIPSSHSFRKLDNHADREKRHHEKMPRNTLACPMGLFAFPTSRAHQTYCTCEGKGGHIAQDELRKND